MIKTLLISAIALTTLSACSKPADPVQNVVPTENVALIENVAAPAPANTMASAKPVALDALKEGDDAGLEPGCFCSFSDGKNDLLTVAATKAVIRVDGALKTCAITEEQSSALTGGDGEFTCGGNKISLKGKGKVEQGGEDTFGRDGTLTISRDGQSKSYAGGMGCAC